jgi:hypothetical protein
MPPNLSRASPCKLHFVANNFHATCTGQRAENIYVSFLTKLQSAIPQRFRKIPKTVGTPHALPFRASAKPAMHGFSWWTMNEPA